MGRGQVLLHLFILCMHVDVRMPMQSTGMESEDNSLELALSFHHEDPEIDSDCQYW